MLALVRLDLLQVQLLGMGTKLQQQVQVKLVLESVPVQASLEPVLHLLRVVRKLLEQVNHQIPSFP
jgi:hypothetical protein